MRAVRVAKLAAEARSVSYTMLTSVNTDVAGDCVEHRVTSREVAAIYLTSTLGNSDNVEQHYQVLHRCNVFRYLPSKTLTGPCRDRLV